MAGAVTARLARWVERLAYVVAAVCLAIAAFNIGEAVLFQATMRATVRRALSTVPAKTTPAPADARRVVTLPDNILGELVIPRLDLDAVVVEGEDRPSLRVGIGHLRDTPLPWQPGNSALAAHRDTFFRPLGQLRAGDLLHLRTAFGTFNYRVVRVRIVRPNDLSVLRAADGIALTLITCYPFTVIGPAPQRWVVQAARADYSTSPRKDPRHVARSGETPKKPTRIELARKLQ